MAQITLDEIIDAFVFGQSTLKMIEIKDFVFKRRGYSYNGYATRYSFDQTIQAKVQSHTRGGYRFREGREIFQAVGTGGYYKLSNHQFYADKRIPIPDDVIRKLALTNATQEDFELTNRTLREINIINRNKQLVIGLKKLYNDSCQLCSKRLEINNGNTYSEVHHLKPLGQPHNGPDTISNMIVVCPNCHVQLDFKAIKLTKDKLTIKPPHYIDDKYVKYANNV